MNEQNTELHYAKNIAKQRKTQRNIFIGLFSFMTILFIISITSLIIGSQAYNQTNNYKSFLNYDYTVTWGGATIWSHQSGDYHKIDLYFDIKSRHQGDIKWDGVYPNGYFNK